LKETSKVQTAGFALDRVYFAEQALRLVQASPELPESEAPISFGWDWRVTGPRNFEVILQLRIGPTRARPEDASVVICGAFAVSGPDHSVATLEFVKAQGPAILFPYLREGLAALTTRGAHGTNHLAPVNVLALMQNFDPEKATGALQLKSGSEPAFLSA
jgi:preprotein translocase subunit SecB